MSDLSMTDAPPQDSPASPSEGPDAASLADSSPAPIEDEEDEEDEDEDEDEEEDDDEDNDDNNDAAPPMVVSRARRSNAGNRMATLLALADADEQEQAIYGHDDWNERADDAEFGGKEAEDDGDISLESSSDGDEDEDEDEFAGEQALKKQERADKARNRKHHRTGSLLQSTLRKRIKLNKGIARAVPASASSPSPSSSGPQTPQARPKKKSERVSWLPTGEEGPIRSSTRTLTKQNTEHTHQNLRKREASAVQIREAMEAAQRRREAARPRVLTQAERLAEAAKVEVKNSKSLYKWEEAENKRAAERQALLDSMRNRSIEGPFVRYYSGPAKWVNDKLVATGKSALIEVLDDKEDTKDKPLEKDVQEPAKPDTPEPMDVDVPAQPETKPGANPSEESPAEASTEPPAIEPSATDSKLPQTVTSEGSSARPKSSGGPADGEALSEASKLDVSAAKTATKEPSDLELSNQAKTVEAKAPSEKQAPSPPSQSAQLPGTNEVSQPPITADAVTERTSESPAKSVAPPHPSSNLGVSSQSNDPPQLGTSKPVVAPGNESSTKPSAESVVDSKNNIASESSIGTLSEPIVEPTKQAIETPAKHHHAETPANKADAPTTTPSKGPAATQPLHAPPSLQNNYGLPDTIMFAPPVSTDGFLSGIMDWAAAPGLPTSSPGQQASQAPTTGPLPSAPNPSPTPAQAQQAQRPNPPQAQPSQATHSGSQDRPIHPPSQQVSQTPSQTQPTLPHSSSTPTKPAAPPVPAPPPTITLTHRNLITLHSLESLSAREKDTLFRLLLTSQKAAAVNSKARKLEKPPPAVCAITAKPARYRDPTTQLPYRDGFAYKCVRRLVAGSCAWSETLGCYVGPVMGEVGGGDGGGGGVMGGRPAAGVPEGFYGPVKNKKKEQDEGQKEKGMEKVNEDKKVVDVDEKKDVIVIDAK